MIVVSGCPRSGTSLTMLLMSRILGEERILGKAFPKDDRQKQQPLEPTSRYNIRQYMLHKDGEYEKQKATEAKYKDMNPNGFWECQYSVQGINYNFGDRENLQKYLEEDKETQTCVKIVSQGLLPSDPRFIDKIVYLVRHPRKVAKSQERLTRGLSLEGKDISEHIKIHDPSMYIQVTAQASKFLLENPNIPIHFLYYDDLITDPAKSIEELCNFLGVSFAQSWAKVANVVNPQLRRSAPEDIPNASWQDAEEVFTMFGKGEYQEVLTYLEDPNKASNRAQHKWRCERSGNVVDMDICKQCKSSMSFRDRAKEAAELRRIDWREKPCLLECGLDLDKEEEEFVTPEQSIKDNFWYNTFT